MLAANKNARPSLGERFSLAYRLGRSLAEWHSVGWVHKGVASKNVVFFRGRGDIDEGCDFSRPFLAGFEYSRPAELQSDAFVTETPLNFDIDVYRHPDRIGLPQDIRPFTPLHDYYAFGVMLLEIGLWVPVKKLFPESEDPSFKSPNAADISSKLVKYASRMRHLMGERYMNAVRTCLRGDFGGKESHREEFMLVERFTSKVLNELEPGLRL
jgi:hypothetical protein